MSGSFTCSICGESHAGSVKDWAFKLPDVVWAIPEADRADRSRHSDDLCQLDDQYFIRCVLELPFTEQPSCFGWGVWAEVDRAIFERYLEVYDTDGSLEPMRPGVLANELDAYPGSIGTPVFVQFRDAVTRPALFLAADDHSVLAREQRSGINDRRYHDILSVIDRL